MKLKKDLNFQFFVHRNDWTGLEIGKIYDQSSGKYFWSCLMADRYFDPLLCTSFHSINPGYRIIKFNNSILAAEQNTNAIKLLNVYIVYDLDDRPKISHTNFKVGNCFFVATNVVENTDKEKWMYSGYGKAFDGASSLNFGNDFAKNVIIFGSSSLADNHKNNFLMLDTFGINGSLGTPEKKFSINFTKAKAKFCLNLHYNHDNSYLFVKGKQICKFKVDDENVNFPTQFCLEAYLMNSVLLSLETYFSKSVYDVNVYSSSFDSNAIDRSNIYKYFMVKNNVLSYFCHVKQLFIVLLSFSGSRATKCMSLNNEPCMIFINILADIILFFLVYLKSCSNMSDSLYKAT